MIVFPTHTKEKSRSGSSWRCWSLENNIDTFFLEIRGPLWLSRLQSLQLCGMLRSKFVKFLCSAPCLLLIIRNICIVNKNAASVYCIHYQPYMYDFTLCLWQPTPVFLPGESQERGSLVGCRLWGCTESDMTEVTYLPYFTLYSSNKSYELHELWPLDLLC